MRYIDTNVIVRFLVEEKTKQSEGLRKFFLNLQKDMVNVECLEIVFLLDDKL